MLSYIDILTIKTMDIIIKLLSKSFLRTIDIT